MKTQLLRVIPLLLATGSAAMAQASLFTNFIRQVQMPTGVQWDATVAPAGEQLSPLSIDPGGARFELWTVQSSPLQAFLLDTRYVGAYVPMAQVLITSEDTSGVVPRTRADRPFWVTITVDGLLTGDDVPISATKVKFLRHVQSYGVGGTGANIDRSQASLIAQSMISEKGTQKLTFTLNSIPFADRSKVRGEERFSFFSLADYQAPESQLASQFIQVWPVADGTISGITHNQKIRLKLPPLTFTLNDLYPSSTTYAQVYKGDAQLGMAGTIVPGSALAVQEAVPQNRVLTVKDYAGVFSEEGRWTMELVTVTAFGMDRLAYVSFDLNRTIKVVGGTTTYE